MEEIEDTETNIKYMAIYNFLNSTILVDHLNKNLLSERKRLSNNISNLIDKLSLIGISANERHTENLKTDKILVLLDSKAQWCYTLTTKFTYSERLGYQILNNLVNKFSKTLLTQLIDPSSSDHIKHDIQLSMSELESKYRDPSKVDTISAINTDLKDLSKVMKKNVYTMIGSVNDAKQLNEQSNFIKDLAKDFSKNAKELKRVTYWQDKKLLVVTGTLGLGAIGYFVIKYFL